MALTLPFNYNPSSVSVKTGSYTIPADTYAYVIPASESTEFTIDSARAQIEQGVTTVLSSSTTTGSKFTAKGACEVSLYFNTGVMQYWPNGGGTGSYTITASTYTTIKMNKGDEMRQNTTTSTTGFIAANYIDRSSGGYWVPAATQLAGDRYTVMEFSLS